MSTKDTPAQVRMLMRNGKYFKNTCGLCDGYKQANVVIVHKSVADDLERFCRLNSSPLPLLCRSKPGQFDTELAKDSDIRTDMSGYWIYEHGKLTGRTSDLKKYNLKDYASFYIGCSFSFEEVLQFNGIPIRSLEQKKDAPLFRTNIPCQTVGPFNCNMTVSYRPIPRSLVPMAISITSSMTDVHGAPIYIGDPAKIGIDINNPPFGEAIKAREGDIPVFWGCGMTLGDVVMSAKESPLSFTQEENGMYITDIKPGPPTKCENITCEVVKLCDKSELYSVVSKKTFSMLQKLEHAVAEDPGNRGIEHLFVEGDFIKAALALSHAKSVALTTGFPVFVGSNPPDETDGLPGILCLKRCLESLGKNVVQFVDKSGLELNKKINQVTTKKGLGEDHESIIGYGNQEENKIIEKDGTPKFDVVLASERCGRSSDGRYYSMRGKDVSLPLDPIDDLFQEATKHPDVITIGIGDGGNELGMGKVFDSVTKNINMGEKIGCTVAADLLVAAGVSNWGCYALTLALLALRRCPDHERYVRHGLGMPFDTKQLRNVVASVEKEKQTLEVVESFGIRDGVSPDQKMSVDGMLFDPVHAEKITDMKNIIEC